MAEGVAVYDGDWGGPWKEFEWLVIVGSIVAFAMAWGIGANDVANAFGTAVGAKTLHLWQACIIAAVFEFAGAIGLGGSVTQTVAGRITSPEEFQDVPEVFAFGMLCALTAAWLWLTLATYLELAVSTTHSVIGAVIGFGLVFGGKKAIIWSEPIDTFPYVEGILPVIISWFTSPLCAGIVAIVLFVLVRTLILRRENAHVWVFWCLPPLVFVCVFVNVFFVLFKGAQEELSSWPPGQSAWVAAVVGVGCALISLPFTYFLRRNQTKQLERFENPVDLLPELAGGSQDWNVEVKPLDFWGRVWARIMYPLTVDVHQDVVKDSQLSNMHSAAEVFDPRAEEVFKYLQVFSSCCVSFAHGANDVANAVGPLAAIWFVYKNHEVQANVPVPIWILAIGGAGIVVGLGTYGYKIVKVLGVKMAKMTPSRGFCAELATALTVAVASVYGLPISTTHCIVGAEVGVGIMENIGGGINWRLFAKTVCAWIVTLAVAGFLSAGIFAFGSYSPSLNDLQTMQSYEQLLLTNALTSIAQLNASNYGNLATLNRFDTQLNSSLSNVNTSLTNIFNGGAINDDMLIIQANYTANLYFNQTVPVVGFNRTATRNNTQAITVPT